MKAKIILAIVWTSLSACERQERSTVLTDESKRILEHFDFSNFDKQEALNYIDRQRYENQIRGKRSQNKLKGNPRTRKEDNADVEIDLKEVKVDLNENIKPNRRSKNKLLLYGKNDKNKLPFRGSNTCCRRYEKLSTGFPGIRTKRGHGSKKKHRRKSYANEYGKDGKRRKRRKKKKKRKRYWGSWSEWSPCSVTCGRGRKIRWRKCIAKNCNKGELEMGEKACQLPACNLLTKLLGL